MNTQTIPWYRQPLVWMIIAIPSSAVIAGAVTMWLAVSTDDGLVTGDYYKQGLAINKQIERDESAKLLMLSADIKLDVENALVNLAFDKGELPSYPEKLSLVLRHVTRGDSDVEIELLHGMNDNYIGYLKTALPQGAWYIELGNKEWRLSQRHNFSDSSTAGLRPVKD